MASFSSVRKVKKFNSEPTQENESIEKNENSEVKELSPEGEGASKVSDTVENTEPVDVDTSTSVEQSRAKSVAKVGLDGLLNGNLTHSSDTAFPSNNFESSSEGMNAVEVTPKPEVSEEDVSSSSVYNLSNATEVPQFTVVDMGTSDLSNYTREFDSSFAMTNCIAEIPMLLNYMVKMERTFNITLPFSAYGVDTIVFDEVAIKQENGLMTVDVEVTPTSGNDKHRAYYEKIVVDGTVYFSCLSESLDTDYLYKVITEAAESMFMNGEYIYTLVGPRPLMGRTMIPAEQLASYQAVLEESKNNSEEGSSEVPQKPIEVQQFIETLKLNSFEMSVLINYMHKLGDVEVTYGLYRGHEAIMFKR